MAAAICFAFLKAFYFKFADFTDACIVATRPVAQNMIIVSSLGMFKMFCTPSGTIEQAPRRGRGRGAAPPPTFNLWKNNKFSKIHFQK